MSPPKKRPDTSERALLLRDEAAKAARSVGGRAAAFLRGLPGAGLAEEQLRRTEQAILSNLKERMDRVAGGGSSNAGSAPPPPPGGRTSRLERTYFVPLVEPPRRILADLLQRAEDQTREQALEYLHASVLRELVPDEAKLLGTLAQGAPHAVIQLFSTGLIGTGQSRTPVMENVSSLGKSACTMLQDMGSTYISHLLSLGLAELGPEEAALKLQYELLESSMPVRQSIASIESRGRRAKIVRESIRISAFGQQLWNACSPGGDSGQLKIEQKTTE